MALTFLEESCIRTPRQQCVYTYDTVPGDDTEPAMESYLLSLRREHSTRARKECRELGPVLTLATNTACDFGQFTEGISGPVSFSESRWVLTERRSLPAPKSQHYRTMSNYEHPFYCGVRGRRTFLENVNFLHALLTTKIHKTFSQTMAHDVALWK